MRDQFGFAVEGYVAIKAQLKGPAASKRRKVAQHSDLRFVATFIEGCAFYQVHENQVSHQFQAQ